MGLFNIKHARYAVAACVMLLTVLVYLPALGNNFVQWDDDRYVFKNEHIRSLGLDFFKWAFTSFHAANWHPLTWVSHAVDYALWGLAPLGHHLTSIILHGFNTFLVVLLTVMLMNIYRIKKPLSNVTVVSSDDVPVLIAGAVTGLLFGLHPVHVESVVWVSERKDVLCAFFFLLSILAYLKYAYAEQQKSKTALYVLCLVFFVLALLSKPMAVTLPVVLLVLDVCPLGRLKQRHDNRAVFMEKAPFFVLSALSSVLTVLAQKYGGAIASLLTYPFIVRLWVSLRGFGFYLFKMIWPTNLAPYYPYPEEGSLFSFEFLASVFFVAAITLFCILSWRRRKIYLAVLVYYIVTLLPVSGIIQVGGQAAADRYSYLPALGPELLIGAAASWFWEKTNGRDNTFTLRRISLACFFLVLLMLAIATIKQTAIWHDPLTLWNAELKVFPENPRAISKRGEVYFQSGDFNRAMEHFNKALEINPLYSTGYYDRGITFLMQGNYQQAISDFNRSIELNPNNKQAAIDRRMAYKLAIKDATKAIEASPDYADAYFNRGLTYELLGDYPNAIKDYDKTIALHPGDAEAILHRAETSLKSGNSEQATKDFQAAARLGNSKAREYLQSRGINW